MTTTTTHLTRAQELLDASRQRILDRMTEPGNPPVGAPYPFVCDYCDAPMYRDKCIGPDGTIHLVTVHTCEPSCTEPSFH